MSGHSLRATALILPLVLAACAVPPGLSDVGGARPGFETVSTSTRNALNKDTIWLQSGAETQAMAARVHAMAHKRTISADTAVQIALLNNRGLQAAYADLGETAAQAWQQTLLTNPKVSVGAFGIGQDGLGGYRSVEGMIATNLLSLTTRDARMAVAELRYRQAQLAAVQETLRVAADTRRAWIEAVAAFETAALLRQAQESAEATSELASELGKTGFLNKADQAREHVLNAELAGQRAQARLAAELAKERLTRLMGLWGTEVDYYVPDALPALPANLVARPQIEAEALARRVDLALARLDLEAQAKQRGLTEATRHVSDLELIFGAEYERELEKGKRVSDTLPQVEIEFDIPVFDSGKARLREAEMAYMRSANQLAQLAVNIRSEARSAYKAYTGTHAIAGHYHDAVLPLRRTIESEALLSYNGMITSTFELLADTRARVESQILDVEARRAFWLAEADLSTVIYGGGSGSAEAAPALSLATGTPPAH